MMNELKEKELQETEQKEKELNETEMEAVSGGAMDFLKAGRREHENGWSFFDRHQ